MRSAFSGNGGPAQNAAASSLCCFCLCLLIAPFAIAVNPTGVAEEKTHTIHKSLVTTGADPQRDDGRWLHSGVGGLQSKGAQTGCS